MLNGLYTLKIPKKMKSQEASKWPLYKLYKKYFSIKKKTVVTSKSHYVNEFE